MPLISFFFFFFGFLIVLAISLVSSGSILYPSPCSPFRETHLYGPHQWADEWAFWLPDKFVFLLLGEPEEEIREREKRLRDQNVYSPDSLLDHLIQQAVSSTGDFLTLSV